MIYYRSGDVLFGPPSARRCASYLHEKWRSSAYGDTEAPILTQAKLEECESLAEKVRLIKTQLSKKREERLQRRMRQLNDEDKTEMVKPSGELPESYCGKILWQSARTNLTTIIS